MHALIAAAVDEKQKLMATSGHKALPGAIAAVRRLARGSKLAVVSGASGKEVRDALTGIGVRDLFATIVAAEDYAHGKPSPEPYLKGLAAVGVPAGRTLVIEDATPGIQAARAAGLRVIGVQAGNFAGYDLSQADVVVDTLDQVTDELCARLLA